MGGHMALTANQSHSEASRTIGAIACLSQGDLNARFGRAVKKEREAHGISQAQLARGAQVSTAYISRIERSYKGYGASLFVAVKIAAALGCGLDHLLTEG